MDQISELLCRFFGVVVVEELQAKPDCAATLAVLSDEQKYHFRC